MWWKGVLVWHKSLVTNDNGVLVWHGVDMTIVLHGRDSVWWKGVLVWHGVGN